MPLLREARFHHDHLGRCILIFPMAHSGLGDIAHKR